MKHIHIVFKIVLPLFIGLFLIAAVSIYTNFYLLEKNISIKSEETFDIISSSLDHIIDQDTDLMLGLMEQLEKDQNTINLFQENKHNETYEYLHKTFLSYSKRYDITHFYIHKANKQNFIRIHNKNKHSDIINRVTLNNAAQNLKMSSGVEFGISHNLTLRVVLPWIVDDKLIGFLELGKEIDKFTPKLTELVNVDIVFTLKKELISKDEFEKWKNKTHRNRHYEAMNSFYVIDSTIDLIDMDLLKHLDEKEIHPNHYIENDNKKYFVHSSVFHDINGQNVGHLHILSEVTKDYEFLFHLILKVTFIVLMLLAVMVVYYYKFLQKKEAELNEAYLEIQRVSITDVLTDLYNKRFYLSNAPKQVNTCSRCNAYISFILIDADNFKKYNDNYGHLKGDDVLRQIGSQMNSVFKRASDCCYRVGGEEFLIVTASNDETNGFVMAQKLCKEIESLNIEHKYNDNTEVVTVSMGVCTKKAVFTTNIDEMYDCADKALYMSKNNGRNKVTVF